MLPLELELRLVSSCRLYTQTMVWPNSVQSYLDNSLGLPIKVCILSCLERPCSAALSLYDKQVCMRNTLQHVLNT